MRVLARDYVEDVGRSASGVGHGLLFSIVERPYGPSYGQNLAAKLGAGQHHRTNWTGSLPATDPPCSLGKLMEWV